MTDTVAFAKRLKRRVTAHRWDFFAVTTPGLETWCRRELEALPAEIGSLKIVVGGVRFRGRLHDGYTANLNLRTATRILMRIAHFRASNFRRLQKEIAAIDWELFLPAGCALDIRAASRHSRLYHREAVTEVVRKAVSFQLGIAAVGKGPLQRLQLRLVDDRVSVSLDTSGDALFKRGLKTAGGRAPLRETMAAAILMAAGFGSGMALMDPMCGTGTFSLEGALLARQIAPGRFREFAFMRWPAFAPGRWKEALRQADLEPRPVGKPFIFATDIDPAACDTLRQVIEKTDALQGIQVTCRDFFDVIPDRDLAARGLVVLNPPYGRRIGSRSEGRSLATEIFRKLRTDYRGWKLAMILPRGYVNEVQLPFSVNSRPFYHGGLKVALLTGAVP